MLSHPNIKIILNTTMREMVDLDSNEIGFMGKRFDGQLIYTGMIDELFDFKFGELPYRAIRFEHETMEKNAYQNTAVVNYPNNFDFTRITEFKYMTGQTHRFTSILREYPCWYAKDNKNVPSYPVPTPKNNRRLEKYMKLIKRYSNLLLIGRLAEYRYYDMDGMVARALEVFNTKLKKHHSEK
jgi:UDP-galactopyranose mutase